MALSRYLSRAALGRCRQRRLVERKRLAGNWQDQNLAFATEAGTPARCANIRDYSFKSLLDKAGLPLSLRVHDLRHMYATLLLSKGEPSKFCPGVFTTPNDLDDDSKVQNNLSCDIALC